MAEVFATQTADGTHTLTWNGGGGTAFLKGTMGGATVSVKVKDGADYMDLEHEMHFTSPVAKNFLIGACTLEYEIKNAGSNGDTSLTLNVVASTGTGP